MNVLKYNYLYSRPLNRSFPIIDDYVTRLNCAKKRANETDHSVQSELVHATASDNSSILELKHRENFKYVYIAVEIFISLRFNVDAVKPNFQH